MQAHILHGFLSDIHVLSKYNKNNALSNKNGSSCTRKHEKKHKIKCVKKRISTAHKKIIQLMSKIKNNEKITTKNKKKQEALPHKINKELTKTLRKLHPHNENKNEKFNKVNDGNKFQDRGSLTEIPLMDSDSLDNNLSLKGKSRIKLRVKSRE